MGTGAVGAEERHPVLFVNARLILVSSLLGRLTREGRSPLLRTEILGSVDQTASYQRVVGSNLRS
jgi:hypothetical protein